MRRIVVTILAALCLAASAFAAGTITQGTVQQVGNSNALYTLTFVWAASSGGAVSGGAADLSAVNLEYVKGLYLYQVETYPTSGGTAPSADYDIALNQNGADLMGGTLANRSASATEIANPTVSTKPVAGTLSLVVSNAGNAGQGTTVLYFSRSPGPGTAKEVGPPAGNYVPKTSNGTTDVTILAASSTSSIVVDSILVENTDTAAGYGIRLCDGACSTANWIRFGVPKQTASGDHDGIGGATNLNFSGTKNTALLFKCETDCTTNVTVSVTYHLVARP